MSACTRLCSRVTRSASILSTQGAMRARWTMSDVQLDFMERLVARNAELRALLERLLDPEDLGHAVSEEVRRLVHAQIRGR
jgi:hypothetical protein